MMKSFKTLIGLFFILTNLDSVRAQAELTGFFDVYNSYEVKDETYSGFQINQFELDISYSYQKCLSLGTALAYNPDNRQFELALAYLHYNIFNEGAMHPRREEEAGHSGIIVGKFDLPFGLDYLNFASPDRPVFSAPLVLEKTIGGRNDIGVNYHIVGDTYKINVCAVNGFNDGLCLGSGVKAKVTDFLQLGASYTSDFEAYNSRANWAGGVDIMAELGAVEIKSEYIWTRGLLDGAQDSSLIYGVNEGMYIQTLTQLEPLIGKAFFLTMRYGFWKASADYDGNGIRDYQNRITLGLGYQLAEGCSVRAELLSDQSNDDQRSLKTTVQLVTGF
jgi:hypothetical protein